MPSLVTERIESVKSGIVGAGAFAIAELIFFLLRAIAVNSLPQLNLAPLLLDWQLLIQLAIGAVSGFLFGVTYRYVIRDDRNSHLNDGAVLAFGLVRGLASIETSLETNLLLSESILIVFLFVQSIIGFAIARLVLDLAIQQKLIKPFV